MRVAIRAVLTGPVAPLGDRGVASAIAKAVAGEGATLPDDAEPTPHPTPFGGHPLPQRGEGETEPYSRSRVMSGASGFFMPTTW